MAETILQINHLSKAFGSHEVLRDIDFSVEKGDVISIIGASGSGKSTLLRCVNLLETPTSGEILYRGVNVAGRGVNAPQYRAHVGMVFQSFNLFNNMTVLENCVVGQVKVLKKDKAAARQHAMHYLEKVGMAPYINAKPRQISGGQKQRVAIARMLMQNAPILIFDDSMSAVDTETDASIRAALKHRRESTTTFIISHRITTLCEADKILVLEHGRLVEQGTHEELIAKPGLYRRIARIQNALEEELKQEGGGSNE